MKVKIEDVGSCRKIIYVDAPADAVAVKYNAIVKLYAKSSKIPGFRKGKAPIEVAERRYAKEIIEETKNRLVPEFYHKALTEKKIEPVAVVDVSDIVFKKGEGITFKATVDVAPEFNLPKYKKMVLKRNKIEISHDDEKKAFERFLNNFATFEAVTDRSVQEGDFVILDYNGEYKGTPVAELVSNCSELCARKDFSVSVSEPGFLPGISAGLVGTAIDEQRKINVHFPDNYHVSEVAGKDVVYNVLVKSIKKKKLPELNNEFLQHFEVDSEEALRNQLRENLKKNVENNEKQRLKNEVIKFLLEKTTLDLPLSIVEQEKKLMIGNMVREIAMQGGEDSQIVSQRENIINAAAKSSTEKVKISYILNQISEEENIKVEESEVNNQIELMAKQYKMTPSRFKLELEKKNSMEDFKNNIRVEKTLTFLLEQAKIK